MGKNEAGIFIKNKSHKQWIDEVMPNHKLEYNSTTMTCGSEIFNTSNVVLNICQQL